MFINKQLFSDKKVTTIMAVRTGAVNLSRRHSLCHYIVVNIFVNILIITTIIIIIIDILIDNNMKIVINNNIIMVNVSNLGCDISGAGFYQDFYDPMSMIIIT